VGCVGTDGAFLVELLAEQGVRVDGIRVLPDQVSGHAVIQVNDNGENSIVIAGGANRCLSDADFEAALSQLQPDDWLLLQNEINDLPAVLESARRKGARVAFNIAPVDGREAAYDLSAVDLLIVNELEAQALVDADARGGDDDSIARLISAQLPETDVVLTRGAAGLIRAGNGKASSIPPFDVTAVDETAAGDAFIGYLMAGILAGKTLDEALLLGSAAGALAVTRHGAASSIPERSDVSRFLR
jgi:ribokinase